MMMMVMMMMIKRTTSYYCRPLHTSVPNLCIEPTKCERFQSPLTLSRHFSTAQEPKLGLSFFSYYDPHPDKVENGGEDAHFFDLASQTFAVADGVGGWIEMGVDPGIFSRRLAELTRLEVAKHSCDTPLRDMVKIAHEEIKKSKIEGSSTFCFARFDQKTNKLHIFNIGDSGLIVIRNMHAIFTTTDLTSAFNTPVQLGYPEANQVEEGVEMSLKLQKGDLVVMCTDGMLDNLFPFQIAHHVKEFAPTADWPGLAKKLVESSQMKFGTGYSIKPFGVKALQYTGHILSGEKLDDTTVIIGLCDVVPN